MKNDASPRFPASRRTRLAALSAGVVLAYAAAGFFAVPWLVKRQVVGRAGSQLHRRATLAGARFNPFTLELRLIGLDLRDRDGTALVAFDTMVVNVSTGSMVKRAVVLDEFRLVRPQVALRLMADGRLAVNDLLAHDSTTRATDTTSFTLPRFAIARFAIRSGTVRAVDLSRSPALDERFDDLGLTVDDLSTLPRTEGDHRLTVSFANGAQITWSGRSTFEPLHLDGQVAVTGLALPKLDELFGAKLPFKLVRGTGHAELQYVVDRASGAGRGVRATVPAASITLRDLALQPDDRKEDWLRAAQFEVQGVHLEWPARTATVSLVRVQQPWIAADRDANGKFAWSRYLARLPHDSTKSKTDGPAWSARINSVEVVDGSATLTDRGVSPPFELGISKIGIMLAPVSTDSTAAISVQASALAGKTGRLSAKGSVVQSPLKVDLDLAAQELDLTLVRPYLGAAPPATVAAGMASLAGKFRMQGGKPAMGFDGRAAVEGFALRDSVNAPLLSWAAMKVAGIHYTASPDLLRVRSVTLDRPFARIAISRERTINLMSLKRMIPAADSTAVASAPSEKPAQAFPYEIGEVAIVNGSTDFSDASLVLPFRVTIDSTHGVLHDIASFGATAGALTLEGLVAPNGLARITGSLQAADPFATTDIRMDIRNIAMPVLTPYSAQFAGYTITQGRLDMDLNYRIQNRQLKADHHITATNLQLGAKVDGGESPGFLVKLAVSLLKDSEGRIKLDMPVEGSVDAPEFDYRGIAWQAVKQILKNVATAPFRFLGRLLGIKGDDGELVDFDPGRADVIAPEREKLDSLVAQLSRKPELTLTVEGHFDSVSDAAALREAKLQKLIAARRDSLGGQADTNATTMVRILEQLYTARFTAPGLDSLRQRFVVPDSATPAAAAKTTATPKRVAAAKTPVAPAPRVQAAAYSAEMRRQLLAAQVIEANDLMQLGRDRAAAIVKRLTASGTLDSSRVTLLDPSPVKRKKQGSALVPSEFGMNAK